MSPADTAPPHPTYWASRRFTGDADKVATISWADQRVDRLYRSAMRAYVHPTDVEWSSYLRARPHLDEVNFWIPSGTAFRALAESEPFLFKSKAAAGNRMIGGGLYSGSNRMRVSEAWEFFGEGNGSPSEAHLLEQINRYRARSGAAPEPDPTIGCILLREVFFVPEFAELAPPPDYRSEAVRGRGYSSSDAGWSHLEQILENLLWRSGRVDESSDLAQFVAGPTRGAPRLVVPRIGQQAFKSLVLTSYQRRCAITRSKIRPVLEAAHIRPVAHEGQHRVDNGLLLRTDVHRLFDGGYLGVDEKYRLQVSPRLRSDFGNGTEFYARSGEVIELPSRKPDRPDKQAVTWHMDTVFKHA